MDLNLGRIGQVALPVADVDRSEAFYGQMLGLRRLYRFGDLTFFDCAGTRLMLERARDGAPQPSSGAIYLRCADIALAVRELERRGVAFDSAPHLVARMDDHDLWMAFFKDPDGHVLALMMEAPKGYACSVLAATER
ncbi:MAG: VOC family protein [Alphaproteobacteria bacterium]|nr:VOC family protein [Alphaproteobacteria bacterium]